MTERRKKTLGETRLSRGASSPPARRTSSLFQLQQSQIVRALLVPVVFSRWLSRRRVQSAMSSAGVGVGPFCFLKTNVTAPVYRGILEHFMLPSADQLFKDADFIFQQDLASAHTAKSTKSWLNDHGVDVLDWPPDSPDLNPRESMGYCQEENEKQETKKCRWAEGHCQRNLGFHTTSAVPQTA